MVLKFTNLENKPYLRPLESFFASLSPFPCPFLLKGSVLFFCCLTQEDTISQNLTNKYDENFRIVQYYGNTNYNYIPTKLV